MADFYTFAGVNYTSVSEVRKAIFDLKQVIVSSDIEVLKEFGVTEGFYEKRSLDDLKRERLEALSQAHDQWLKKDAWFVSSLGFALNGHTDGILNLRMHFDRAKEVPGYVCNFVDFDDAVHELTETELGKLYEESGMAREKNYMQKWLYRSQIEQAKSERALDAIAFVFTPIDFGAMREEQEEG